MSAAHPLPMKRRRRAGMNRWVGGRASGSVPACWWRSDDLAINESPGRAGRECVEAPYARYETGAPMVGAPVSLHPSLENQPGSEALGRIIFRRGLVAHHDRAILRDERAVATRSYDRIERDRKAGTDRDAHPARRKLIDQVALVGQSAFRNV